MGLKTIDGRMLAGLALVGLLLAGCSSSGGPGGSSASMEPAAKGGLSAAEISSTLAGKSWRWKGPTNTGTTLYASDGTSLMEVDGKGKVQGKWIAKDGQLCESFSASPPLLPADVPLTCVPFSRGAPPGTYQNGKAVFTLAS